MRVAVAARTCICRDPPIRPRSSRQRAHPESRPYVDGAPPSSTRRERSKDPTCRNPRPAPKSTLGRLFWPMANAPSSPIPQSTAGSSGRPECRHVDATIECAGSLDTATARRAAYIVSSAERPRDAVGKIRVPQCQIGDVVATHCTGHQPLSPRQRLDLAGHAEHWESHITFGRRLAVRARPRSRSIEWCDYRSRPTSISNLVSRCQNRSI
jgi:hypothetical protein